MGGVAAAYTLIETRRMNSLDPEAWLRWVLILAAAPDFIKRAALMNIALEPVMKTAFPYTQP